jgi:hypothetical protein
MHWMREMSCYKVSMSGSRCVVGLSLGGLGLAACGDVVHQDPGDARSDALVDAMPLCVAPSSTPSAQYKIDLFADAAGRTGPYTMCPTVGTSSTGTNPQYISCRRLGGEVRDSAGNYNHYWLWTALDSPSTHPYAWISAYYIQGEGNDEAYDFYTKQPIADCP